MPKTSVNEYDSIVFWKNNIRLPRQIFTMKPKTEAVREKEATNQDLGLCVLALDTRHTHVPLFFR